MSKIFLKNLTEAARIPAILILVLVFCILLVAQRVAVENMGDNNAQLKEELRLMRSNNDKLTHEIEKYLERQKLERFAYENFGLSPADYEDVIVLKVPKNIEEPQQYALGGILQQAIRWTWDTLVAGPLNLESYNNSGSI